MNETLEILTRCVSDAITGGSSVSTKGLEEVPGPFSLFAVSFSPSVATSALHVGFLCCRVWDKKTSFNI